VFESGGIGCKRKTGLGGRLLRTGPYARVLVGSLGPPFLRKKIDFGIGRCSDMHLMHRLSSSVTLS